MKKINLSEVERLYLDHLLKYADEELFVYSSNFLKSYEIGMEKTPNFINDLRKKVIGDEDKYVKMQILYLCNGLDDSCDRCGDYSECYLRGGSCKHTTHEEYAKNPEDKRAFVKQGDLLVEMTEI